MHPQVVVRIAYEIVQKGTRQAGVAASLKTHSPVTKLNSFEMYAPRAVVTEDSALSLNGKEWRAAV